MEIRRSDIVAIFLTAVFLLASCATEHRTEGFVPAAPEDTVHTFDAPVEEVYFVFLNMLSENEKIDIGETLPEEYSIVTLSIPLDPKSELGFKVLFREDGEKRIDSAKYDLAIDMEEAGENRTRVKIIVHIDKYVRGYTSYYDWREQPTNGVIEQMYFDKLAAALQKGK